MHKTSPKRGFYTAVFLLVTLAATSYIGQKPSYNWDLFPYMAIAMSEPGVPLDSVHARVYRAAEASMPARDFQAISSRQPALKSNPSAFEQVLKYFKIKPLYNAIVSMLYRAGVNPLVATYLPSVISFFLTGCLLFWWIGRMLPIPMACLASWSFMAMPFMLDASRLSSPDMLCAFIQLGGLYILCEVAILPGLVISLLAILARPDAVVLALLIALVMLRTGKISIRHFASFVLAGLIGSLYLAGGFLKEFLFTSSDYSQDWTFTQMSQHYMLGLRAGFSGLSSTYTIGFVLLGIGALVMRTRIQQRLPAEASAQAGLPWASDLWTLLVSAALLTMPARYLLHPAMEDRFLIPCYLVITLGFLHSLPARRSLA